MADPEQGNKTECNRDSEDQETKNEKTKETESPDLDDLLDSALEDFDKPVFPPQAVNPGEVGNADPSTAASSSEGEKPFEWSDEFVQQATAQFEDAMKNLLSGDDSLSMEFRRIAEASGKAMTSQESENRMSESLAQTLRGLAENAEAVSNPLTDEEISQLLGNIGLSQDIGTDGGEPEDLLNVMKNVLQNLLSKDLLYPSLKDIVEKYPNWLAENQTKLTEAEYARYGRQFDFMKRACDEFETEKEEDSDEVKKIRFEKVLDLMQKMQECGHPPKELIGDMVPGFEVDESGVPRIPGMPLPTKGNDSCCVM